VESMLGGKVYQHNIDGWLVAWESHSDYRHWCLQEKPDNTDKILVVMKNPGSLSGDGSNLRRDSTLRILRAVGNETRINHMVTNLFDYASPKLPELHANWDKRDRAMLVYPHLVVKDYRAVLFAYGDVKPEHEKDYLERIALARTLFKSLPEIVIPKTKAGNPVHTMNWQRQRLINDVIISINNLLHGA
jgi:hypothetical protein